MFRFLWLGEKDDVLPLILAMRLFELTKEPKTFVSMSERQLSCSRTGGCLFTRVRMDRGENPTIVQLREAPCGDRLIWTSIHP
jgi:hypothetical protein